MEKAKEKVQALRLWLFTPARLWGVLCCGFVVFWLLHGAYAFAASRILPQMELDPTSAARQNLALEEDNGMTGVINAFRSENADPQMIFEDIGAAQNTAPGLRQVLLVAGFERGPDEMVLYYARKQGQGFSEAKRVVARPYVMEDGRQGWLYTLPPGKVRALRLDPGNLGDNGMVIESITLNPRLPAAAYFTPTLRDLARLAVWPALACLVFYTIIEGISTLRGFARRKRGKTDE